MVPDNQPSSVQRTSPLAAQRGGKAASVPTQKTQLPVQMAKKQRVEPIKTCWPDDADSDNDFK